MENSSSCACTNTPEDSGLGESSQNESNSNSLYTPTTSFITSRKRKLLDLQRFKPFNSKQTSSVESVDSSPWIKNTEILSSTFNDSLTAGVENCKLDSYSSNFYSERSELEHNTDVSSLLKNIKEPLTPEKRSNKRYCNTKSSPRVSPLLKLGSPERNEILYSNLPSLSRFNDSKRCSPAKKCLFKTNTCRDPVALFCRDRDINHVITKIFRYLSDEDLHSCSKVCKLWKGQIKMNYQLKKRLRMFVASKIMNKENDFDTPSFNGMGNSYHEPAKQSTPMVPIWKMLELTNSLTEGQHIEKCLFCNRPEAIVERNISQCTNETCRGIRCLKCSSICTTGPQNFVDKCQESALLIEKPPPRYSLLSSPKRYQNADGIPTFFLDDSINTSQTFNSSGYLTDNDLSQTPHRHSISFTREKPDFSHVLKTCNMQVEHKPEKTRGRRSSVLPVISTTRKKEEIIEPSSPPKIKYVACTKKSKKMLKRLNL